MRFTRISWAHRWHLERPHHSSAEIREQSHSLPFLLFIIYLDSSRGARCFWDTLEYYGLQWVSVALSSLNQKAQ